MNLEGSATFGPRYELRKQLWWDGPHAGWLGLDRNLGREIVINFPYLRDDHKAFLQRAQIRARLRHASLLPILDQGATQDGTPFFTEADINAMDLNRLLSDPPRANDVTLVRLVHYLLGVCRAVTHVHAHEFLHLALHPGDVLVVSEPGEAFLIRGHPSLPPVFIETPGLPGLREVVPAYAAPEQVSPESLGAPDALTDVYGLGGILFAILYGSPPNVGESGLEQLNALMARKGQPPRRQLSRHAARHRELAQSLEPICGRALEYERTARQPSVAEFVDEIERAAAGNATGGAG